MYDEVIINVSKVWLAIRIVETFGGASVCILENAFQLTEPYIGVGLLPVNIGAWDTIILVNVQND